MKNALADGVLQVENCGRLSWETIITSMQQFER